MWRSVLMLLICAGAAVAQPGPGEQRLRRRERPTQCCEVLPNCICISKEDSHLGRLASGAVELRVDANTGAAVLDPTIETKIGLQYHKNYYRPITEANEDPAVAHMMHVLTFEIQVLAYYSEQRKTQNKSLLLPLVSVAPFFLENQRLQQNFSHKNESLLAVANQSHNSPPSWKQKLPPRWLRRQTLRFRLNESEVARSPTLMSLTWNSSQVSNASSRIPGITNISLIWAKWEPFKQTATLEPERFLWKLLSIQMRLNNTEGAELGHESASRLSWMAPWLASAMNDGVLWAFLLVCVTAVGLWGLPPVSFPQVFCFRPSRSPSDDRARQPKLDSTSTIPRPPLMPRERTPNRQYYTR